MTIGPVKNEISMTGLAELYAALVNHHKPKPGTFSALDEVGRREYFTLAKRRSRAKVKEASSKAGIVGSVPNIRDALADAALMILATDSPGAEQVRNVLRQVFAQRPGIPLQVENRAKRGKLKPKLISRDGL